MTYRYKKRINSDAGVAADDDDCDNTQTQTLSSLTGFSSHICSWFLAVSVHTL